MHLLLDTDVVLDVVLAREPFADDAAALWTANDRGELTAVISPITPVNVFYVVRKLLGAEVARRAVHELLAGLRVCALDERGMRLAATMPLRDFEDAVQVAAAMTNGVQAIVTRNTGDYVGSPLPAIAPHEVVRRLSASDTRP